MDDATLRLLHDLRAAPDPRSVESFAWLLAGRCPGSGTPPEHVRIAWIAERATAWARAHVWLGRAEAYRVVYSMMSRDPDRWPSAAGGALAIESLTALPRPERAALALACVCGFADAEVARVIEVRADEVPGLIERAVEAVLRVRAA